MENMAILDAVEKLEESNEEQKQTLEQLHEQFKDLRKDPRFAKMPMDDLEKLCVAYLETWIKTNKEIIDILKK